MMKTVVFRFFQVIFFVSAISLASLALSQEADHVTPENQNADEEDTPVSFTDHLEGVDLTKGIPWAAPNYKGQEQTLGYGQGVFDIPKGMEDRVKFWIDIYTKYGTDQGILHDSKYVNLIYEAIDFSDIMRDSTLTPRQQQKARKKRVDDAKKRIKEKLLSLQEKTSPEGLSAEDLRYWNMFNNVEEVKKFKEAAQKGRLRFQLGQRDRIIEGVYQSGRYLKQMENIFTQEGVPRELIRLVFVESSFNLKARSKVGASGIWQFMRYTARQYMRMDFSVDERNDPLIATRAAARKLKENYKMLESWPLAVTGYNHGPSGVRRLVDKYGTRDLAELTDVRRGRFGFASASFYASFLAALEVEKNVEKYYGNIYRMPELIGVEFTLERNLAVKKLLEWFGGNLDLAKDYNPHVHAHIWNSNGLIGRKNVIRVPEKMVAQVGEELKTIKEEVVAVSGEEETYQLMPGETLSEIAQRFGVSVQAIIEINGIADPRTLRAGQKLIIPAKPQRKTSSVSSAK